MPVRADKVALREALERAVRTADRGEGIPNLWVQRTEHIGDSPSQTMVAFLGNALLARATFGEAIDPRSIKARSGERGYSTRGTVSVLVAGKRAFGYGLGVEKAEPLNNQPFLRPARVDEIGLETVRAGTREYLRSLKGYLRAIDSLSAKEAEDALAAFIVVRRRVAEEKRRQAAAELKEEPVSLSRLARVAAAFVADRPEAGRRGQALAAAALDCVLPRVDLGAIHDPDAFDVIGFRNEEDEVPSPVVQVKQKVVGEDTAVELAEAAAEEGAGAALLVAIANGQQPLDEEAIASRVEPLGVIVLALTSVAELLRALAAYSASTPQEIAAGLPRALESRMREIGCEADAVEQWRELVAELAES
jgi:SacI restriction endonuclease